MSRSRPNIWLHLALLSVASLLAVSQAAAREVDYRDAEVAINVTPGEPTQVDFPAEIAGGFKKKASALSIERQGESLIIFAQQALPQFGEVIIARLGDGRSYSLRVQPTNEERPRDTVVRIVDKRRSILKGEDEAPVPGRPGDFDFAPATHVSGLMREMVLITEFGKSDISGYRESDRYHGQTVLNDGALHVTIDKLLIGPTLWGYVLDAKNLLDTSQMLNPATFRLDGTRAISLKNWELTSRPINIEQQIAAKHTTKIYVVTRAR